MNKLIPITDLRKTNEISSLCNKEDKPIFVTKNGYSDLVIMSSKVYERLERKLIQESSLIQPKLEILDQDDCMGFIKVAACNFDTSIHNVNKNLSFHLLQFFQNLPEIFRQRSKRHHRPAISGMGKAQDARMQTLALLAQFFLFVAVDRVAQNGVADVGLMDTDLVGAAGLQLAADVGIAPVAGDDLPMGHGLAGISLSDAHLFPV